jgi:hypothetical protein
MKYIKIIFSVYFSKPNILVNIMINLKIKDFELFFMDYKIIFNIIDSLIRSQ